MKPNRLKAERTLRGWSQARVAEAVGTNVRTVIRWEQGQSTPHPYYQEQLCTLFSKSVRELGLLVDEDIDNTSEQLSHPQYALQPAVFPLFDPAIPVAADSLIGRELLLSRLRWQLLEGDDRSLLALQGLPGMGKTSLALALTGDQALRERFCDGVLWAGLGQEPDVLGQLARWGKLLGVAPGEVENVNRRESWSRALRAAIGSRRLLLVIDDAWSAEDALAFQVGGSQCAHLLTTRLPNVAFAFAREGTLAIPELQNTDGLHLLARFVPHLVQQDEESAQALVRAVGGSPLALTLMGNYLAAQAFTGQARRLRQALAQLRDAEQRMRLSVPIALAERSSCLPADTPLSLYAAIEVSVHHLDAQDHATLCALAAFPPKPNSFSEEAALAVSASSVERLDALWDAGLLESSGSERYTLHQTIVDYANTRCKDMRARQRLLSYTLWYIQEYARDYEALEREQSNILAALDSAEELGMPQALLQGAIHLTSFMHVRGHYALAHRLLSQAQQVALQQKDAMGHMHVLRHLAAFAELRGDYAQAERYSQEGLDLARQLGSPRDSESSLLTTLGLVSFHRGDYERAKNLFEEGLRLARNFGNNERICTLLTHLGRVLHFQGNYRLAEALYQEGLVLARHSEQQELLNLLLIYMGGVNLSQGNHLQAQRYYEEGLVLARSLGHREYLEALLNDMGVLAYNRGDLEQTMAYFQEGLALARQIGQGDYCCLLLSNLGEIAVKQGNYAQAEKYLREGIELARHSENRNRLTHLLSNLGSALGQQGDYERANRYFRESLDLARAIGAPWHIYSVLMDWGEIHLKYQQLHTASAAFHEILAQEQSPAGEPELIADAKYGLARVASLQGRIEEALHFAQESEAHFAALGHFKATTVREWWQGLCQSITLLPSLIRQ